LIEEEGRRDEKLEDTGVVTWDWRVAGERLLLYQQRADTAEKTGK